MTTKAPETIWLWKDGDRRCVSHQDEPAPQDSTRYVRADLHAAVVAERDEIKAALDALMTEMNDIARAALAKQEPKE